MRKFRHDDVRLAVVVIVLKHDSHPRKFFSICRESHAGVQALFGECAIAIIVKQKLAGDIIGDENVSESIAIVIGKGHAQAVTLLGRDSGFHTDIFKSAIAPIVIKNTADGRKFSRRTVLADHCTAWFAVFRVPIEIAGHD